jgi:hypothetical protein
MMSGVEVMKNFVVQVIRACCKKKKHMGFVSKLDFRIFKNKRTYMVYVARYNILTTFATTFSQHLLQHVSIPCQNY